MNLEEWAVYLSAINMFLLYFIAWVVYFKESHPLAFVIYACVITVFCKYFVTEII